jgi:hypothetical protein
MQTLVILAALALLGWIIIRSTKRMSDQTQRLAAIALVIEGRVDAATALFAQLADIIRDLKDDPAELEALANRLEAQATELGQAIESYDPDAEPPEEEEPPVGEDTNVGGQGDDTLSGGQGDDTQFGGQGDDTLTGNAQGEFGSETLTDFKAADEASGKSKRK